MYIVSSFKLPKHLTGIKDFLGISTFLDSNEIEALFILYKYFKKRKYKSNTIISEALLRKFKEQLNLILLFPEYNINTNLKKQECIILLDKIDRIIKIYNKIYIIKEIDDEN